MKGIKLLFSLFGFATVLTVSPSPSQAGSEFDKAAAAEALKAVDVQHCKKANGPTGDGHLVITFASTGAATLAAVDRPPFQGTPVGKCVQKDFKKVKVPPFSGPITIGKNFKIE